MIKFLISIIIGIIFQIISIIILPRKKYYEYDYLYSKFKSKNYDFDDFFYNYYDYKLYFIELIENKIHRAKNLNQTVLAFIIICLIFLIGIIVLFLYYKYEKDKTLINLLLSFNIIFNFINWCIALAIVAKINKVRKKFDEYKLTNKIKSGIVVVIVILTANIILYFINIAFYDEIKTNSPPPRTVTNYIPTYTQRETTGQAIQSIPTTQRITRQTTSRTQVIHVQKQAQYLIRLKSVVSSDIYSKIKEYVERGKVLLTSLMRFYIEMKFIGFTSEDSIINEIKNTVAFLGVVLKNMGDDVARICMETEDENALFLLIYYIFPLIILVIRLKIEKGIYRKPITITTREIQLLTSLERDNEGNVRATFRFNQQISQTTLLNLLG